MNWNRYPVYKDSAVAWLGDVPEHWAVDQLKWTFAGSENGTWGEEPDGIRDVICVRVADFDRCRFRTVISNPTMRAIEPEGREMRILRNGDLLLEKSGGGELQPVGVVVLFDHHLQAVCSNFVSRLRVRPGWDSRFLTYLNAHLYSSRVNIRSIKQTTGIQNLDSEAYLHETIAYPRLDEQRAIAVFLDQETERIDTLIAKKERQIELLQEKRSALISHAVTKGLNPDAKMKDSGIEWLGAIPQHWEIKPLKRVATFQRGHDLTQQQANQGDIPVISSSGYIGYHDQYRAIGPGLVTGRYGTIGKFYYVEGKFWPMNTTLYCVNNWANNVRFLWYLVQNISQIFLLNSAKSAVPGVDRNDLHPVLVAIPPSVQEQESIAHFLDTRMQMLDTMANQIQKSIELLAEYRMSLISATVTGKIDIRQEST